ncbi:MAG TPA: NrsF family protein [Stellaceae bacterium]|nr:NrsF family protein [Stellaceae bacterium]
MSDLRSSPDVLIQALTADLSPVRRLVPPPLRALGWLAAVGGSAAALACFADLGAVARRLAAAPDMWLAVTGSLLTAVLAALAAFQTVVPDRKPAWALLPLPGLLLWASASGLGCLRTWFVPEAQAANLAEARSCLVFILGVSVPLSVLLVAMLRRGYSLRPNLTATTGGLAAAAAAATLLNLFHPYDAAATDLAVHALAVTIVILANRTLSGRVLRAA